MSFEILSYLEQRFGGCNVTFECSCAIGLNHEFDARRSLQLAALTIFNWSGHDFIDNLGLSSHLSLAAAMRIGAVARLKLRMTRWLFVADFIISHFSLRILSGLCRHQSIRLSDPP